MKQVTTQHDVRPDQVGPFRFARAVSDAAVQFGQIAYQPETT